MTSCIDHCLITASAGSGKTYTLANRMIRWLICHRRIDGVASPQRLLGSTFTRKAAGEILHRILKHLVQGVIDAEYCNGELATALAIDPPPSQDELAAVLDEVIDALGELQLGTLDSLFMQMATLFAPALGLPPGWTISDAADDRQIKQTALRRVLSSMDRSEVVSLLLAMSHGEAGSRAADAASAQLFGRDSNDGAWQIYQNTRLLNHYDDGESGCLPSVAAWMWMDEKSDEELSPDGQVLCGGDFAALLQRAHLAVDTPEKAWASFCACLEGGDWKTLLGQTICVNVHKDVLTYSRAALSDEVVAMVREAIAHAQVMIIRDLRTQNRSVVELLQRIQTEVDVERDRRGRYGFSDVTSRLAGAGLIGADSLEDLWFRMSVDIRDVALDEFQDTSVEQYMILQPIIEQIMAGDGDQDQRGFLIVADPKQSIYGWRGGTPALVDNFRRRYGEMLDPSQPLVKSYRSSPVIMEFVNLIFGDLLTNPAITHSSTPIQESVARWSEHFLDHESAREDLDGIVTITIASIKNEASTAIDVTRSLHEQSPDHSIGVLCGTNKQVAAVVAGLRQCGLDVSQEGGGEIDDDLAVAALLSLLDLSDHPGDTISLYHVLSTPLGVVLGVLPWDDIDQDARAGVATELASSIRGRLQREGYGEVLNDLAQRLRPSVDGRSMHRLRQLVELGGAWDDRSTLRATDFISFVQQERVSAVTEHPVRVMSVHASKGLEFDEVVLVGLDRAGGLKGRSPSFCCAIRDVHGITLPTRVCKHLSKELWPYFPVLEEMGFSTAWQRAAAADSLSALYVAITRAKCGVHGIIKELPKTHLDKPEKHPISSSSSGILRGAIDRDLLEGPLRSGQLPLGETIVVMGNPKWSHDQGETAAPVETAESVLPPVLAPLKGGRHGHTARPPSDHGVDLDYIFSLEGRSSGGRLIGSLVHEAFARIVWWDDNLDLEDILLTACCRGAIDSGAPPSDEVVEIARSILNRCTSQSGITARLSPQAYSATSSLEVLNEHPWVTQGDEGVRRGRIDRLVIGREDGRVVWADVVDYKTDRIETPQQRDEVVGLYTDQITAYREVVAKIFGLDCSDVTGRLLLLSTGEDVEIPSADVTLIEEPGSHGVLGVDAGG